MSTQLVSEIYGDLFNTAIAFLIISLAAIATVAVLVRKTDSQRRKYRIKIRAFYIAALILLFIIARIWVEGFTHLLAVLGLVSAALVITNKESIMNVVGWLIITWRELFAEDDLVQIQDYKGYVKRIGMLYFTLAEVSSANSNITGRIIRVPNGLASNNALINFSQTSHLLEQTISFDVSSRVDLAKAMQDIKTTTHLTITDYYKNTTEYSAAYLAKNNKHLRRLHTLDVTIAFSAKELKQTEIELEVSYYCFVKDIQSLRNLICVKLHKLIQDNYADLSITPAEQGKAVK